MTEDSVAWRRLAWIDRDWLFPAFGFLSECSEQGRSAAETFDTPEMLLGNASLPREDIDGTSAATRGRMDVASVRDRS